MNQFDKKHKIVFNLKNINSIALALEKYKKLLDEGKAIETSGSMGQFDVEFVVKTPEGTRRLQISDTQNIDLVKKSLNMGQEGGSHNYPNIIGEDDEIYISEILFFAIALEYSDLKEKVFETAQAMVNVSRYHNDGSDMWVDDMRVFGVEALYILAKIYPEYSYLLAQFLIPYWDDEHAVGYEDYLHSLVIDNGWTKDNIKAFIWCDNFFFRQAMNLEDNLLGNFLKENPSEYIYFKEELKNRLIQQPILLPYEDEQEFGSGHILSIYFSMMIFPQEWAENMEENDDELDAFFINDTLENEALQFEEELKKVITTPLTTLSESAIKEKLFIQEVDDYFDNYEIGDALPEILNLFSNLPQGEKVCNYITTGENKEVLDGLETVDFVTFTKKHSKVIHNKTVYYTDHFRDNKQILDELDGIFSDLISELLSPEDDSDEEILDNGMVVKTVIYKTGKKPFILSEEDRKNLQEKFLRILDVLYIILGREILSDEIFNLIANPNNEPIISRDEFFVRYSGKKTNESNEEFKKRLVEQILSEALDVFTTPYSSYLDKDELEKAEKLYLHRDAINCFTWYPNHPGSYCLAAYLLHKDFLTRTGDETTRMLNEFISKGAVKVFAKHILSFLEEDKYHENKDVISSEDRDKLLEYFTNSTPKINHDNALELLKQYLGKEEIILCAKQKKYNLFSHYDIATKATIFACYLLGQMPLPSAVFAKRIWRLCVALAPQKTIKIITSIYTDRYDHSFKDMMREINHYESLEKSGVPKAQILAFQMVAAQDNLTKNDKKFRRNYEIYIDMYDEIDTEVEGASIFSGLDKKNAIALDEGMHYIKENSRIQFFRHLALQNSRFPFNQQDIFNQIVERLVKENLLSLAGKIANLFNDEEIVFMGRNRMLDDELREKRVFKDESSFTLDFLDKTIYNYDDPVMVLQECGEKLYIVVNPIIKNYSLDGIEYLGSLYLNVNFVILKQSADISLIKKLFDKPLSRQVRVDKISQYFMAYLEGEVDFSETLDIFCKNIRKDFFREKYDAGSGNAKVSDFMGVMSEDKLDRLIKLLVSHTSEAFDMLSENIDKTYLEQQVLKGKMEFRDYLDELSEKDVEYDTTISWLLKKIIDVGVPMKNIFKIIAEKAQRYDIEEIVWELSENDEFRQLLSNATRAEKKGILELLEDIA